MSSHVESWKSGRVSACDYEQHFSDPSASIMGHQEFWRGFLSLECYNCSCLSNSHSTPFWFIHFIWQTRKAQINKSSKRICFSLLAVSQQCRHAKPGVTIFSQRYSSGSMSAQGQWSRCFFSTLMHSLFTQVGYERTQVMLTNQNCRMVEETSRKLLDNNF